MVGMGAGLMESGGFLKETIPQLDGRCPDQDDDEEDTDNDNDNDDSGQWTCVKPLIYNLLLLSRFTIYAQ